MIFTNTNVVNHMTWNKIRQQNFQPIYKYFVTYNNQKSLRHEQYFDGILKQKVAPK